MFVLDSHGSPLMPCHPARARKLLQAGRARVHHLAPFVIRLVDREAAQSEIPGVEVGIDPGSKHTGIALFGVDEEGARHGLVSIQVDHRGQAIQQKMGQRAACRRGRRSRKLRYRQPRFDNRTRPEGWLAPSLRHRVDGTMSMLAKLRQWAAVHAIHLELVRFDMQQMQNPEVSGVEYQQGTLAGFEVREYLLHKFDRRCAYCGAAGVGPGSVPLNMDHIVPRSRGGSNRVSNLTLACVPCNEAKGNQAMAEWLAERFGAKAAAIAKRVLASAKAPLKDAAAVNTTRWALWRALTATGVLVATGSGGRTKWNRSRFNVAKSHTLDALCVGDVDSVVSYPSQVIVAKSTGRGAYQRARPDKYGFTKGHYRLPGMEPNPSQGHRRRCKAVFGFQTGDLVRAVVPSGKKAGVHLGRVAVRSTGSLNIRTQHGLAQGISYKHCTNLQRADGWGWSSQSEGVANATSGHRCTAMRLLPALTDGVSVAGGAR
ncbi:MAG: RNA-guided endonuclease IscB [Candidatus Dormibacteria bacterium]